MKGGGMNHVFDMRKGSLIAQALANMAQPRFYTYGLCFQTLRLPSF